MKNLLIILAALALSGCASYRLPAVTAESIDYHRTDPIGGTKITAKGVKVTDGKVKAEEATWVTQYPQFSVTVTIKGYERKIDAK